ncbi:hypothetical protein PC115_g25472, partial [Phytophthora cactorum]
CAWFRFAGRLRAGERHQNAVLLLDVSGLPGKRVVQLQEMSVNGQEVEVWADAGNNDLFGKYRGGTLKEAVIAYCREDIRNLYYDTEVLLETAEQLHEGSARKEKIFQTLYDILLQLTAFSKEHIEQAKKRLDKQLSMQGGDPVLTLSAIGHAHIDLAWLWPIRETIRKGARTFSTVLRMMERYPDYVFGASQPQLYDWMKQHYPKLYDQIKER